MSSIRAAHRKRLRYQAVFEERENTTVSETVQYLFRFDLAATVYAGGIAKGRR
jgi:hypothetical protein